MSIKKVDKEEIMEFTLTLSLQAAIFIFIMAFIAEYFDSTLGMGYGTSLTPLLLIYGFPPLQIVPAILASELITGFVASILHNKMGNVKLYPKLFEKKLEVRDFMLKHLKIAIIIGSSSIVGTVVSVFIAVNIPHIVLKLYIGILIFSMGLVILLTLKKHYKFRWKKVITLSIIASFNKGLSGGGYGPVVTSGQLLSGVDGKNAVGITSLAESLTCLVGLALYYLIKKDLDMTLFPYLAIGGILSVPLSAFTVKKIPKSKFRIVIGSVCIFLGLLTLVKILF